MMVPIKMKKEKKNANSAREVDIVHQIKKTKQMVGS